MKHYRFRSWLRRWINHFDDDQPNLVKADSRAMHTYRNSMNFSICRATGGYIVEYNQYDHKLDEHNRNLHIVTEEQDLGDAIAKIVTLEMLRN